MLRHIKISVDAPYIDPTSSLQHTGTSYQVSKTTDFDNPSNLILNIQNDQNHLLEYIFEYDFEPNQSIYIRTKYHFNNGTESDWSMIVPHNANQIGFKTSNTIVATPVITAEFEFNNSKTGEVVFKLDGLNVISGPGHIVSTSWIVEDLTGHVIYNIPKSTKYLQELKISLAQFDKNKAYVVKAITHTDTNVDSNPGKYILTFKNDVKYDFEAELYEGLFANSRNYVLIKNKRYSFSSFDLRITDINGTLIETIRNLDPDIGVFESSNLVVNQYYSIDIRGILPNEPATDWVNIYKGPAVEYRYRVGSDIIDRNIDYLHDLKFTGYTNFNGLSSQTLVTDENNLFWMGIPETDKVALYRAHVNGIYSVGKELTLPNGMSAIPNINTLHLPNRNIVIDYNLPEDTENEKSQFAVCDYNHVSRKLSVIRTYKRNDERYSTGRSGSAVVTKNGLVYYIPGMILDGNNNAQDLELRVYNPSTNTIVKTIPLPVSGLKQNTTLALVGNDDIYFFGGTTDDLENNIHGELSANVLNRKIFKLNINNDTWEEKLTVSLSNPNSYRYNMIPMINGKIAIIDVTPDIVDGGNRVSYVYNPNTNAIEYTFSNNPRKEHIGVTIQTRNGDIILMSSTPETVETISYFVTEVSDVNISNQYVDFSDRVGNLVVPVGETVYVRDPYRYDSITIEGDSPTNTGKLVWVTDHTVEVFDYNDLLVTRDMTLTEVDGQPENQYDKVVVFGDATLTVVQQ